MHMHKAMTISCRILSEYLIIILTLVYFRKFVDNKPKSPFDSVIQCDSKTKMFDNKQNPLFYLLDTKCDSNEDRSVFMKNKNQTCSSNGKHQMNFRVFSVGVVCYGICKTSDVI